MGFMPIIMGIILIIAFIMLPIWLVLSSEASFFEDSLLLDPCCIAAAACKYFSVNPDS